MGLQLIVKNEDFSAISVGVLKAFGTSVSSGLQGLFLLSNVLDGPTKNWATGANATIVGSPTVASIGVTSDKTNYIDFGIIPSGDRTVVTVSAVETAARFYFSSFAPIAGEYFESNTTPVIQFAATTLGGSPYPGVPAVARDELIAIIVDDRAGVTVYRPRTATSGTKASVSSQTRTNAYRTSINSTITTAATRSQLFAYWNRVLTTGELDAFYAEMQAQMAALGVATI